MTKFIVIEGIDGTGKKTQYDLLVKYIRDELKKPILELDFPQYGKPSAVYVERYLNGEYGTDVHPDLASILYAFDRWQSKSEMAEFLGSHSDGYMVANRYVISNLAHQGGKISDQDARHQFYEEQMNLEFEQFGIPRPNINFVMLLPEKVAQENVDKKAQRSYTDKKRDIHEADLNHLHNAANSYREICNIYSDIATPIDCWDSEQNVMLPVEAIHSILKQHITSL